MSFEVNQTIMIILAVAFIAISIMFVNNAFHEKKCLDVVKNKDELYECIAYCYDNNLRSNGDYVDCKLIHIKPEKTFKIDSEEIDIPFVFSVDEFVHGKDYLVKISFYENKVHLTLIEEK